MNRKNLKLLIDLQIEDLLMYMEHSQGNQMGNSKDLYEKFKAVSDIEKQTCKNEANIKKGT